MPLKKPLIELRIRRQFRFNALEFDRIRRACEMIGVTPTKFVREVAMEQADIILDSKKRTG